MKTLIRVVPVLLLFAATARSQSPPPAPAPTPEAKASAPEPKGCLIVKHKGTLGRRLLWTALVGLPIAPGAKYDLVDSVKLTGAKLAYKGKELQELQAQGVHVIVLETKYTPEELESARKACSEQK